MAKYVPRVTSLEEVYSGTGSDVLPEHKKRFKTLLDSFKETFQSKPDFVSRSPGRVNIIGEHIDYSLYNVLPTALTVDVLVAVKASQPSTDNSEDKDTTTIEVTNTNPSKYPSRDFQITKGGSVELGDHEWSNYFKAGYSGALEFLRKEHDEDYVPTDMKVMIDGDVPAGGGLSSSAAFVCASALAVMAANDVEISKQDLLDLCIVSERSVGVYSGGMDQAASIFSERGYLLYCQFFPKFRAEHVPVPKADIEFTFLIAQSFVTSDKAVTAPKHYNLRVVECTLATVVLAKLFDISLNPDESSLGFCMRNFQEEYMKKAGKTDLSLDGQLDLLVSVVEEKLIHDAYTREEISQILGISVADLKETYMSKFPVQAEDFKLRQRAQHVVNEARRVIAFKDILTSASKSEGSTLTQDQVSDLGNLMNQTQESCRNIYECSCPEIDDICAIARKNGALGSRLTGAGWGGCTVHLIPQDKVDAVTEALKQEYYHQKFPDLTEEQLKQAIVISKPSQGSSLIVDQALDV